MYRTNYVPNFGKKQQPLCNLTALTKQHLERYRSAVASVKNCTDLPVCHDRRKKRYHIERQAMLRNVIKNCFESFLTIYNSVSIPNYKPLSFPMEFNSFLENIKTDWMRSKMEHNVATNTWVESSLIMRKHNYYSYEHNSFLSLENLEIELHFVVQHWALKLIDIETKIRFVDVGKNYFPLVETTVIQQFYNSSTSAKRIAYLPKFIRQKPSYLKTVKYGKVTESCIYFNCFNGHCEKYDNGSYYGYGGKFSFNGIEKLKQLLNYGKEIQK